MRKKSSKAGLSICEYYIRMSYRNLRNSYMRLGKHSKAYSLIFEEARMLMELSDINKNKNEKKIN